MAKDSLDKYEETYNNIIKFYDIAEELIDTVEDESTKDPAKQLAIVEPLILEIEAATDTLAREYRDFVKAKGKTNEKITNNIQSALISICKAIIECRKQIKS